MNKKRKIRFMSIILLIVQLVLCMTAISCGSDINTSDNPDSDNYSNNEQTGDDSNNNNSETSESSLLEELYPYPEYDFKGEVINVLARRDGWYDGSQDIEDMLVEALTGEVLNDAVYKRTKEVEEKYNVQLKMTYITEPTATIAKSVKAGDDEYQLVQDKLMFMSSSLVTQNYLIDLNTITSMNLDAPWYNQNAIKDLSINNKVTAIGGDMTVNDKGGVIFIVFSKQLSADYGLENLYDTVRGGKWTLDKMYELMTQTTMDINGDGQYTFNDDQWGLVCEDYGGWMLAVASGNRLANLDDNGLPYMTVVTEKSLSDYDKIKNIMYEKQGRVEMADDAERIRIFYENRCFFSIDMLSSIAMLRSMDEDFGIIPLPKQNETQKDYITTISPWVSRFISMPSTCGNPEMVGAVVDAMSRESASTVVPAYYDNLLNQKIARDDESIDMLKQIFSSVIYDIGSVYNWGGIWDLQFQFFNQKNEDYGGFYEKYVGKVETALAKTIETLQQSE